MGFKYWAIPTMLLKLNFSTRSSPNLSAMRFLELILIAQSNPKNIPLVVLEFIGLG